MPKVKKEMKKSTKNVMDINKPTSSNITDLNLPSVKEVGTSNKPSLPRLRVLSLFDGIGAGYYSLQKLNCDIEAYYASEIDEDAILVTKTHFGDKITHLGTVTAINKKVLKEIGPINLLIGGSPCNDLSCVNHKRKGLYDCTGTGILFFDYFRIWHLLNLESIQENRPFYWLFENVANMELKTKDTISSFLRCQPTAINSQTVSPQKRLRYFWSNIPNIESLADGNNKTVIGPSLQSFLDKNLNRTANVEKINTITTKRSCLQDGKSKDPVNFNGINSSLFITELENIFGFCSHYTDVGNFSISKRHALIGKSWSILTIESIIQLLIDHYANE